MFFLLHMSGFFGYVVSQLSLSNGSHNRILCERMAVNITCDELSTILINDVQFGPPIYNREEITTNSVLEKETDIKSKIEDICNNAEYCYINNTLNELTNTSQPLPRLTNISYSCEYEYVGCYVDKEIRLLRGKNTVDDQNMSARRCFNICSGYKNQGKYYTYFGTENSHECYCGTHQYFNKTEYPKKSDEVCNASCTGNPNEMCGRHGFISVYKTYHTGKTVLYKENEPAMEISKRINCSFSAIFFNISISIYKYKMCDVLPENKVLSTKSCDNEKCIHVLQDSYETHFVSDHPMHTIPQYARINFSCIPADTDGDVDAVDGEDGGKSITIIAIAAGSGVLLTCAVIVIICLVRRRKQKARKKDEPTTKHLSPSINCAHTEGEEHVYFNSNTDMHEDQTYENSPQPIVDDSTDHVYQMSTKHIKFRNRTDEISSISTQQHQRHSSSSDHYADHAEGVYDRAHKIQYKDNDGNQALYSHAVENVYDSAQTNPIRLRRKEDQLYYQT